MNTERTRGLRRRFADLHAGELFVMPNPWDAGSAKLLASLGFPALATTSSGFAASLGRGDQEVTRDELLGHVDALAAAADVPLNVDAERCFADDPEGVADTVDLIGQTSAAGCSIEDYDPGSDAIDPLEVAVARVSAAAQSAREHGLVLTARAENHLYGVEDLDDTIVRLTAYREAGADVVYAPGLTDLADIELVVRTVRVPVNVLALRAGPSVADLAAAGVRRVSTGGSLAWAAYGGALAAAVELRDSGTSTYLDTAMSGADREQVFR